MTNYRRSKKFTLGVALTDPQQVIDAVTSGKWLYFGKNRVYHPTWIANMNFSCVMSYVRNEQLFFAHRNDEYPYVFKAELMEPAEGVEMRAEWWATCSEVPSARIVEFTKDAVAAACEKAVIEATGKRSPRVTVEFHLPSTATRLAGLLQ